MLQKLNYAAALVALICIVGGVMTNGSSALTVDVARKCQTLIAKAYPPLVPGNPAAGRKNGTAQVVRAYFNKCAANGGNIEEQAPQDGSKDDAQTPKDAK